MSRRRVTATIGRMNDGTHGRSGGAAHAAGALLLSVLLAALGARIVFTSSAPPQSFALTPELWLVAGYLVAPFALALLSLSGSRRAATGVRKLIVAGLAAAVPAAAILIAAFLGSAQSGLPLVIAGSFAVVVLLVPSGRCFDGARALVRGDVSRALHLTRLTPYVIGIPAAIAAGLSAPLALTALQPCDLCLQAFLAVVVLAGYAVPALIAALLTVSARRWLATA